MSPRPQTTTDELEMNPLSSIGAELAAGAAALGAEVRLAGVSAGGIVALGIVAGIAAAAAWLLLLAGAATLLQRFGAPWEVTMLLLAAAHAALAFAAWRRALALADNLRLGSFFDAAKDGRQSQGI